MSKYNGNGNYKKKPRSVRQHIPMGQPESLSWEETPWEYDDVVVACTPPEGLNLKEIGTMMGMSRERARQLEGQAEYKLRHLSKAGFNIDDALYESIFALREIFNRWDRERLIERMRFAERLLEDEDLQDRIREVYGSSLFSDDVDFSILKDFAERKEEDEDV